MSRLRDTEAVTIHLGLGAGACHLDAHSVGRRLAVSGRRQLIKSDASPRRSAYPPTALSPTC